MDSERIYELLAEAEQLPYGELRVKLTEEAVRYADATRDEYEMFSTRMELIQTATMSGRIEKAITAFSWCLAKYEADRESYDEFAYHLLWEFKNLLHNVDEMPQLSLQQFDELHAQMAHHYRDCGYNMRPIHYIRTVFSARTGQFPVADEHFALFEAERRDHMADCYACEADTRTEYFEAKGDFDKALECAQPILSGGAACAEVPHRTYATLLRPLALLHRHDEADELQRKGYRLIRENPEFTLHVGLHMAYLAHRRDWETGLQLLERHLSWPLDTYQLRAKFFFCCGALRVLDLAATEREELLLRLPEVFPLYSPTGNYQVDVLRDWFRGERDNLALRFDQRNGNSYFTKELIERMNY